MSGSDKSNVNPDTLPATGRGVVPSLIALTLLIAGFALLAGRGAVFRRGGVPGHLVCGHG